MVYITKTSEQARVEREKRKKDSTCPECGHQAFGGCVTTEDRMFRKSRKKYSFSCIECECHWETGWEEY